MPAFTENNSNWTKVHFHYGVFDAHCDTVHMFKKSDEAYDIKKINPSAQVDLPRLERGGVKAQCFALFIEPEYKPCGSLRRCLQLWVDCFEVMEASSNRMKIALSSEDIARINEREKIAALLAVEGGEALEGDPGLLKVLYRLGIRILGLTWNQRNQLADGISEREAGGGLTRAGREVIKEMNRLGMVIDLAHISPGGFFEALEISDSPLIVSHANMQKICDHPRNLTDEQLKRLGENGGTVGLSLYPPFIHPEVPSLDKLLDHFEHAAEVAGIEHVGIGSDFDGMRGRCLEELKDPSFFPRLTHGLLKRGFKEKEVGKILYGNFSRVLSKIM